MSIDDLLIGTIIAGVGLSGTYLRAEFVLHLRFKAAERRKELVWREVHANRARPEQNNMLRQPRTYPTGIQTNSSQVVRALASASRIFIRERKSGDIEAAQSGRFILRNSTANRASRGRSRKPT